MNPSQNTTRRSHVGTYVMIAGVGLFLMLVFAWIVQRQAHDTAVRAARIANVKVVKAAHALAVIDYHGNVALCRRANQTRAAIRTNTRNLAQFEEAVARVRASLAKTEVTAAGRLHDIQSAAEYRKLEHALQYVDLIDCVKTYPNPFRDIPASLGHP